MENKQFTKLVTEWINKNKPYGEAKLAMKAKVSTAIVAKMKAGYLPKNIPTLVKIARVIGFDPKDLF